jgi:hypothetical protein
VIPSQEFSDQIEDVLNSASPLHGGGKWKIKEFSTAPEFAYGWTGEFFGNQIPIGTTITLKCACEYPKHPTRSDRIAKAERMWWPE